MTQAPDDAEGLFELSGWLGRSITTPEPIAFPHELFATVLEAHARLLEGELEGLLFRLSGLGHGMRRFDDVDAWACRIRVSRRGTVVEFMGRCAMADRMRRWRGVYRRLYATPGPFKIDVIVVAGGVVSMHTLAVEREGAPRLRIAARDVVVEPLDQRVDCFRDWAITRWAFGAEVRYAWGRDAEEPETLEEVVDRFVALYETRLRRAAWEYLRDGDSDPLLYVWSSNLSGDHVRALLPGAKVAMTVHFPRIRRALAEPVPGGWLPVLVLVGTRQAGLRWLPLRVGASDGTRPPELTEVDPSSHGVEEREPWRPDDEVAYEVREHERAHAMDLEDFVVYASITEFIAVHLRDGSQEALESWIRHAGIDPAEERMQKGGISEDAFGPC